MVRLEESGWDKAIDIPTAFSSTKEYFRLMSLIIEKILESFSRFERHILDNLSNISYKGPILTYSEFLFPILKEIKLLNGLPTNCPIFLMVDDADNLTTIQKKILNTWVSTRNISTICFKISTQHNYNQFRTIYGDRIETPHDYSEINIADRYTASYRSFYKDRVREVVKKRLEYAGLKNIEPEEFFPKEPSQEQKITEKFELYKNKLLKEGKTERQAYDYAYRYTIPDFIRDDLKGNRNAFSYAGFEQLVNISSGNMRQFIEPAKKMYDQMKTKLDSEKINKDITSISTTIQDEIIKKYSTDSFYQEFQKMLDTTEDCILDESRRIDSEKEIDELKKEKVTIERLRDLIDVLGNMFKSILLSTVSERRVFSIAIQDEPNEELNTILNLGIELGYFQKYVIGNKFGTGKAHLYILNRILAPLFGLDPSSFAGYKFVKSQELLVALKDPLILKRKIRERGVDSIFDESQPSLFEEYYDEDD